MTTPYASATTGTVIDQDKMRIALTGAEAAKTVVVMRELTPMAKAEARERHLAGLKRGNEPPRADKLPERGKGQAREKVAAMIGRIWIIAPSTAWRRT